MKYSLTNTLTLTYQPLNDTVITLQKIIIHLIFFLFILLRQYWQVRAKISGLQKLSTSPYNVCWQFLIERWDKRTLSSHWIFSSSLSLSRLCLSLKVTKKKQHGGLADVDCLCTDMVLSCSVCLFQYFCLWRIFLATEAYSTTITPMSVGLAILK